MNKEVAIDKTDVYAYADVLSRSAGNITEYLSSHNTDIINKYYWIINISSILIGIIGLVLIIGLFILIHTGLNKLANKKEDSLILSVISSFLPTMIITGLLGTFIVAIVTLTLSKIDLPSDLGDTRLENTNQVHVVENVKVKNIYSENPISNKKEDKKDENGDTIKYNYIAYELEGKTGIGKVKRTEFKNNMPKSDAQIKLYTKAKFVDDSKLDNYHKDVKKDLQSSIKVTEVNLTKQDITNKNDSNSFWLERR